MQHELARTLERTWMVSAREAKGPLPMQPENAAQPFDPRPLRRHCVLFCTPIQWPPVVDSFTPSVRSKIMASVRQKDTAPEMLVRRMLHRLGYRYGLHRRDLPGRPDLVFGRKRKVIFVHGCFWHGHHCRRGRPPTSRVEYWSKKISDNRARDERNVSDLRVNGWEPFIVWECETAAPDSLRRRLIGFLEAELS